MSASRSPDSIAGTHRVSQLATLINGFPFDSGVFSGDGDLPLIRIRDLTAPEFETFVPRDAVPSSAFVRDGDVVIGMDGDFNSVLWDRGEAALNQRVCVLRARDGVDSRYLAYAIPPHLERINDLTWSTTVKHLSAKGVRAIRIPAYSFEQQRAIADYLDRETAQIDAFIAKNEELISLLTERRAASIARAVTRGLDDSVALKDSGVETLGPIPLDWTVNRVRDVGRSIIGLTYSPDDVCGEDHGGTLVLRAGNIQEGLLSLDDCLYVAKPVPDALRLRRDDIVICARNGSAHLIGKNALATDEVVGQTWGAFMAVLRSPFNRYLRWVLNSRIFAASLGAFATSTINQLTSSTLHSLQFAMPPEKERVAIADYLTEVAEESDNAIRAARRAIDLARERRAALISAAVTGKIDVGVTV